jgi:uncharacterized DUF497 family protein
MACGGQVRWAHKAPGFQQAPVWRRGPVGFSGSISRRWSPEWRPRLALTSLAVTAHVGRRRRLSQRPGAQVAHSSLRSPPCDHAHLAYIPRMDFEWDDAKDAQCRAERGFGFADSAGIFHGRTYEWQDTRKDYGEVRMCAVGEWDGDYYTVVYTDRLGVEGDLVRRIISAHHAHRKERKAWHASA